MTASWRQRGRAIVRQAARIGAAADAAGMPVKEYLAQLPRHGRRSNASRGNALVKTILDGLAARGVPAWRLNSGAYRPRPGAFVRFGFPGCPDIMIMVRGWGSGLMARGWGVGFIECKTGTGKASAAQADFAGLCDEYDVPYLLAREWEQVERWLSLKP